MVTVCISLGGGLIDIAIEPKDGIHVSVSDIKERIKEYVFRHQKNYGLSLDDVSGLNVTLVYERKVLANKDIIAQDDIEKICGLGALVFPRPFVTLA